MKAKEILINVLNRSSGERGLQITTSNTYLSEGHLKKADHNLVVMTDLNKLGHEDWVVITAYYAMYQAAMALLTKVGLESKDHATTAAILEYFFGEQISKEFIVLFNDIKEKKDKIEALIIKEKYINYLWDTKRARETVQYGIAISYKETEIITIHAREFVSKIKIVLNEIDEEVLKIITKKIKELKALSEK